MKIEPSGSQGNVVRDLQFADTSWSDKGGGLSVSSNFKRKRWTKAQKEDILRELYLFDLPVRLCLKTPVIPAKTEIVSAQWSIPGDFRFPGNDKLYGTGGVSENKKFALKKQDFSNQTGIRNQTGIL